MQRVFSAAMVTVFLTSSSFGRGEHLQSGFPEALRSNLNECLFRKSSVGRPSSAIAPCRAFDAVAATSHSRASSRNRKATPWMEAS